MNETEKVKERKNERRSLWFLLLLIPLFYTCNGEKDDNDGIIVDGNVYITEVALPVSGTAYKWGEQIPVTVKIKDPKQFAEINLWIDDKKVLSSKTAQAEFTLKYPTDSTGLGNHSIRVETKRTDEVMEPISISFVVLSNEQPVDHTYKVVAKLPHDPESFTQGLFIDNGLMYEGTGQYDRSELRLIDFKQNKVLKSQKMAPEYFGEGIALVGNKIYQLTYREHKGFIYDKNTLAVMKEFTYPTEGWGLTYDGRYLIMTDGSDYLYFYEPENFTLVRKIQVADNLSPITMLNELEYINGEIWANVWQTDWILQIDPVTGKVKSRIDCDGLLPSSERTQATDVLNGIAYDSATGKIYVTGKYWPALYEISVSK